MHKIIIISAPSGAGKTTIVKQILKDITSLEFSISATTRTMRQGETNGKDYYFLSVDEFRNKLANNEFVESEEVYEGLLYGTLKSEIDRIWNNGHHVIFDVDVKGGINLKKQFGDTAKSIFIKPPSIQELENRLRGRATDSEEIILMRIKRAEEELSYINQFDNIVTNDNLQTAIAETKKLISDFIR